MKNNYTFILLFAYLLTACYENTNNKKTYETQQDTVENTSIDSNKLNHTVEVSVVDNFQIDTLQTDIALFIAGLPTLKYFQTAQENPEYRAYAQEIEREWKKVKNKKIDKIDIFQQKELNDLNSNTTIFYPFAGADFLYPHLFFPNKQKFILVGLEPAGKLDSSNFNQKNQIDYLKKIKKALYYSNELGFFRTKSMAEELNTNDINGTIHLIYFYLARNNYQITQTKSLRIDSKGNLLDDTTGILPLIYQINLIDKQNHTKELIYLSQDLSNNALEKNTPVINLIDKQKPYDVFLKAASYLLFLSDFKQIQKRILEAENILQDDSGIPFYHLNNKKWKVQLYGKYTQIIPLFANKFQESLKIAYQDSINVKPLAFKIGYNITLNESNLLLAKKINLK